jgi:riboflavin synthase alpha subunit
MIELMRRRKKQPAWGALETNVASLRLAAKLGFVAVDTISITLEKRSQTRRF